MSKPEAPSKDDLPDDTVVGNWTIRRAKYLHIQTALRLLHGKLAGWNTTATMHGALVAPYADEMEILGSMIEWAEPRLADEKGVNFTVDGITVESLRLIKAALLNAAWTYEAEIEAQAQGGWPARVVEAVRGKALQVAQLAESIEYRAADVLQELRPDFAIDREDKSVNDWDVFISHASEDKAGLVNELAEALKVAGLSVWYDAFTLTIGDSLRRSIDKGLSRSRFGIVVLSRAFFEKEWPQRELDGLVSRELDGQKVILPVWHGIDVALVRSFSPTLSDRLGISSDKGVAAIVAAIVAAVRKGAAPEQPTQNQNKQVATEAEFQAQETLIVGKPNHPDLAVREHRVCVVQCKLINESKVKVAIVHRVQAFDIRGDELPIQWSEGVDALGNPDHCGDKIRVEGEKMLYIRHREGMDVNYARIVIEHNMPGSPAVVTLNDYFIEGASA